MSNDRVIRGGSWLLGDASPLAARARFWFAPSYRDSGFGFRCARTESARFVRALRGGGWHKETPYRYLAVRSRLLPTYRNIFLGLRVVRRNNV